MQLQGITRLVNFTKENGIAQAKRQCSTPPDYLLPPIPSQFTNNSKNFYIYYSAININSIPTTIHESNVDTVNGSILIEWLTESKSKLNLSTTTKEVFFFFLI